MLLGLLAVATAACSDPVIDDARDALGAEDPSVPAGPLHRPGQPCVLCHTEGGPGNLIMSFGGTVYKYETTPEPLSGAYVNFIDAEGATFSTATNCAGNFFVEPGDFEPKFPVWFSIFYGGQPVYMSSAVYRERSCAKCHGEVPGPNKVSHVYMSPDTAIAFPEDGCP
jgi:hypothetical protein